MVTSRQLRDEAIRLGIDPDILENIPDDATMAERVAATGKYLPVIVNVYNRHHKDKLELVFGNGEVIGVRRQKRDFKEASPKLSEVEA